jgi:hypothetical protein
MVAENLSYSIQGRPQPLSTEMLREGVDSLHDAAVHYRNLARATWSVISDQPEIAQLFEELFDATCRADTTIEMWSQRLGKDDRISAPEAFLTVCDVVRQAGGSSEHLSMLDVARMVDDLAHRFPQASLQELAEIVAKRISAG